MAQINAMADIDVTLTPVSSADCISQLKVQIILRNPNIKEGQVLVKLPLEIAKVPTARYDGDALQAADDNGPLSLLVVDAESGPPIVWRTWKASRDTRGHVRLKGTAHPRQVDAETRIRPCFDLRQDHGGLISSGYCMLPVPEDGEEAVAVRIEFDLKAAPS